MNAEILKQRELMFKALDLINQMQTFEALFSTVDNGYLKEVLKPIQLQYAETMSTLAGELAAIGETRERVLDVTIHDQIHY